jgi:hypothetical protein
MEIVSQSELLSSMKRIAAIIYCRSISSEFRRPVDCLYPTIMTSYLTLVKTPMDLGTILYACIQENLSPQQFRDHLHLVFNNAIVFNTGVPLMESISAHIDAFAGGLYEEALNMPYRDIPDINDVKAGKIFSTGSVATTYITDFPIIRLSRRRFRMYCVKDMVLDLSEMSMLMDAMITVAQKHPSKESLIGPIIQTLETAVSSVKNLSAGQNPGSPRSSPVSLKSLLLPIIRIACSSEPSAENKSPDLHQAAILNILYDGHSATHDEDDPLSLICDRFIYPQNQRFMEDLDNALGELLVCMHERLLRGCRWSSIWACPDSVVWAQPTSAKLAPGSSKDRKTTWWTGLVVGGGKGSRVSMAKNDCNTTRIPLTFANQLLRTKSSASKTVKGIVQSSDPSAMVIESESSIAATSSNENSPKLPPMYSKYIPPPSHLQAKHDKINFASGNSSLSFGADNKYLVEFFGAHDFGWTKGESILPFSPTTPGPRGCSQDAVVEAVQADRWFQRRHVIFFGDNKDGTNPHQSTYDNDDLMDTEEGAEDEDIELPLMDELEASIRYPSRPEVVYIGPAPVKEYRRKSSASPTNVQPLDQSSSSPPNDTTNQEDLFPIHPLFPVFVELSEQENSSKVTRAIAKTRMAVSWMNQVKPIGSETSGGTTSAPKAPRQTKTQKQQHAVASPGLRTLSPFDSAEKISSSDGGSRSVPIDSLLSLPSTADKKRHVSDASAAATHDQTMVQELEDSSRNIAAEDNNTKPSKRVKNESTEGKKHAAGSAVVCNISTPSARVFAGEGIVHSKVVDLSSPLFFYEDKRREVRKEVLRQELETIESALRKLNQASLEREKQKEKFLSSRPTSSSGQAAGTGIAKAGNFSTVAMGYKIIGK